MSELDPTVGDGQTIEQQLAPLLTLLQQADTPTKAAIRTALGTSGVIEGAPKPRSTNADARRIAYSAGEIIHPEGFIPKPSDALVDMLGKAAAQEVVAQRYRQANNAGGATTTGTAREAEQLYGAGMGSAEELATIAQEEFPTDVPALPAEFGTDDVEFAQE